MAKETKTVNSLRSQLKATSLKKLQKQIDEDNAAIGANSNEYLNLEDGKTLKIRIFPAHPGEENFYVAKKCYWLTIAGNDGDPRRIQVLDSRLHGGTKMDVVEEYTKYAKRFCKGDASKLEAITGQRDSLNPSYSWLCYADTVREDEQLRARLWEMKKMVRDALNRMAFSEDEEEAIEVDPYTDVDEGLPVLVTYRKNPNKKKGENFYEVAFPKKVKARPLTDEEIEYFMSLKPLSEILGTYGLSDFERALEGLQNFDEEHKIGLFDDEDWIAHLEEIRAQYDDDSSEEEEDEKPRAKKTAKKPAPSKVEEPDDEEEEDEEEDEAEDEEEEGSSEEGDEFDAMDRSELKKYIKDNDLDITVKKSMSDDDLREAIRAASAAAEEAPEAEEEEEEAEEEEDDDEGGAAPKLTLADIRKKLGKK